MPGSRITLTLTAVLLTLALGPAPPAQAADPISFSVTSYEGGPVLAADGRVVIGERMAGGGRKILAIDPRTHVFKELARFPPPADPQTFYVLKLAGSGGIVTATLDLFHDVTDTTAEQATPNLLSSRALVVLPALAPLATCERVAPDFPASIRAAGGDGFVALAADDCGAASAAHIRTPNGTHTIPAEAPERAFPPPEISDLRAAGPFTTWTETRFDGGPKASFVAVRAPTAAVLLRAPGARSRYALGTDGTIVTADFGGCSMRVVTLEPLAQRTTQLPAGLCPGLLGDVAVAGGRAVYPVGGGYAVSDLRGAAHPVELGVDAVGAAPVAFDGRTVYGVRKRCHDELLLAVDTAVPVVTPLPLAPPPSLETCPVRRRAGSGRVRVAPDRRVSIRVRCPAGCRGTLRLVEQRRGRRERVIGSRDFVSAGGSFVLRPRIASFARSLAGCGGGLRAVAQVHRDNSTKGLGTYRILSRSRCRRAGGPAFAAPRPWPPRPW